MFDYVFPVSFSLVVIVFISALTYFHINETRSIESNVKIALEKGIDPLAVRCAYSTSTDNVCIAYAASRTNYRAPVN